MSDARAHGCPVMKHVDHDSLYTNLEARMDYLLSFIEFGKEDIKGLKDVAPILGPLIPTILDAVYTKLFRYDVTKVLLLPRKMGYQQDELESGLDSFGHDSEQTKIRKEFLKGWLVKLLTGDYNSMSQWDYMDKVGIMHTGKAGFKHREKKAPLHVEYIHMAGLLGWLETMFTTTLLRIPDAKVSPKDKLRMITALNKIFWIQNDLFARHYIGQSDLFARHYMM
ncbi:hypothetical protein DACRYDRAFT_25113 [Dacryopinax primogenitus]|uniref:Globin-sensor domain-containing protein n=1 Tax=Dacryopinax primogenitus (strain DJM 731) TaxID=1858805 RepID=M5FPU1_DACPD|nr:uncharacterized protein DACRYDRAFT_25113 [Dacryopinax primogenitus]EJT97313.1 hypothetical protein DACRYDRAFT_25113 [Dacryopinax primogenitus]